MRSLAPRIRLYYSAVDAIAVPAAIPGALTQEFPPVDHECLLKA
jgi:hypothetical protein